LPREPPGLAPSQSRVPAGRHPGRLRLESGGEVLRCSLSFLSLAIRRGAEIPTWPQTGHPHLARCEWAPAVGRKLLYVLADFNRESASVEPVLLHEHRRRRTRTTFFSFLVYEDKELIVAPRGRRFERLLPCNGPLHATNAGYGCRRQRSRCREATKRSCEAMVGRPWQVPSCDRIAVSAVRTRRSWRRLDLGGVPAPPPRTRRRTGLR
jgi:hypothetical protein